MKAETFDVLTVVKATFFGVSAPFSSMLHLHTVSYHELFDILQPLQKMFRHALFK